ncbi:aldo/keto reductase [Allostella humosa]|uniref:aldo/keto reductase n=1 Tax=Stella humosa TaxID=94 RepID=UPI0018D5D80E|nr:aldo/keto reductase [Stella humosa]
MPIPRSAFLRLAAAAALGAGTAGAAEPATMATRPIPSTGQPLPVIGCGTWRTFDVAAEPAALAPLAEVLAVLFRAGGSVIDSSPMYGRSEAVVGQLLTQARSHDRAFVATKVWTRGREAGIAQMRQSMALLQRRRVELMQVHNLVDWKTHLATLRRWKAEGLVGHVGITHYTQSAHDELEAVMRAEPLDFVQINYALDDRAVERRILPLAADRGMAVLVNQPFGGGGLLRGLRDRPLPDWAGEIGCRTWAQILLKFLLGHPAVTCVIPGTSRPAHMADNAAAGSGPVPDEAVRARIAAAWQAG